MARLRVHGEVVPDWHRRGGLKSELDFAAVEHGGQVLTCSDMFFGPKHNLIMPGRAINMSDGWETRRRRGPGHDWVIVRLGVECSIRRVEIDTSHFKGNYPDTCSVEASCNATDWSEILPRTKLQADTRHIFVDELTRRAASTHVRVNVYPDGGIARLRVFGTATESGQWREVTRHLNTRLPAQLQNDLRRCCASSAWVRDMMAARPFAESADLLAAAENIWWDLDPPDWQEAFAAHPRIGDQTHSQWARQEQSGTASANEETLRALAETNHEYEKRFGRVFLVCATGKSAAEMLAIARQRLQNQPDEELRIAAEEQLKITKLRLLKLVQ